jgi:hypothetical protein
MEWIFSDFPKYSTVIQRDEMVSPSKSPQQNTKYETTTKWKFLVFPKKYTIKCNGVEIFGFPKIFHGNPKRRDGIPE